MIAPTDATYRGSGTVVLAVDVVVGPGDMVFTTVVLDLGSSPVDEASGPADAAVDTDDVLDNAWPSDSGPQAATATSIDRIGAMQRLSTGRTR